MASIGQGTETEVQDIEYMLWAGTIVTVVSATVAVGLRFLSRYIAKAKLWWDDWVIVVSLIINWTMAITRWMQVLKFSFGKHGSDISTSDIVAYQKSFMAIQLLYFTNAVLTKSSLLLLYQRIFSIVPSYRWAIRFSWFLILSYFISCVIASIAACSPPSYVWNRFRDGNGYGGPDAQDGSCFNEIAFFRWNGIANMLLDVLMLVLPIPMVWRLRAPRRVKVLLSGVFGLGGFVCVVSLLRIVSFDTSDRSDPTYTQIPSSMWSSVEQGTGIVCACLPTLRPLRRLWKGRSCRGSGKNKGGRTVLDSTSSSDRSSGERGHGGTAEMRRWADDGRGVGIYWNRSPVRSVDDDGALGSGFGGRERGEGLDV